MRIKINSWLGKNQELFPKGFFVLVVHISPCVVSVTAQLQQIFQASQNHPRPQICKQSLVLCNPLFWYIQSSSVSRLTVCHPRVTIGHLMVLKGHVLTVGPIIYGTQVFIFVWCLGRGEPSHCQESLYLIHQLCISIVHNTMFIRLPGYSVCVNHKHNTRNKLPP